MILRLISVLALLGWGSAQADTESPLRKLLDVNESKIWQAVGRVNLPDGGFCTGAMISPTLVLTAAHCVFNPYTFEKLDVREFNFAAGFRLGRASARRSVRRIVSHPDYVSSDEPDVKNVGTDIALLELDRPILNKRILPFDHTARPEVGASVQVVSYALDRSNAPSIETPCQILAQDSAVLVMSCHVDHGASGAPIFIMEDGHPKIASVVSAKAIWRDQEVSLGTVLGRPLEELMEQLIQTNVVTDLKPASDTVLDQQLDHSTPLSSAHD